jgi:hyperosmotically inducible protein
MTTRYVLTLCTALVLGAALITGSANALGKADEKTPINDSWLTAKAKIALFADARVKGSEINVETTQGLVMIRGKVDSDAAKQAAESIAKGIDGVKSVKNELQVVAPSKREAIDDKDDSITTRVNEQIAKDSNLKKAGVHAQTNAGVVSLSGEVQDLMTSAQASWIAWQVSGVKSVKNDLTVKPKAYAFSRPDTRALRPSTSDHRGVDGRQRLS